jgi:hypothetical protein
MTVFSKNRKSIFSMSLGDWLGETSCGEDMASYKPIPMWGLWLRNIITIGVLGWILYAAFQYTFGAIPYLGVALNALIALAAILLTPICYIWGWSNGYDRCHTSYREGPEALRKVA